MEGIGALFTPMSAILAQQYRTEVAPTTLGEKQAHKEITQARTFYAAAARDMVGDSVYAKSGLPAPTLDAKVGHNIDVKA